MNESIKIFLESLTGEGHNRWRTTTGDREFFDKCAKKLSSLAVKSVLDIACGKGEFVDICKSYDIKAYGISPFGEDDNPNQPNIYNGTFESVLLNKHLLEGEKFDCISIQNTLHGGEWIDDELIELLNFMKQHSNYIVITDPNNNPNVKLDGFKKIYEFDGSHGKKAAFHKIYKVTK